MGTIALVRAALRTLYAGLIGNLTPGALARGDGVMQYRIMLGNGKETRVSANLNHGQTMPCASTPSCGHHGVIRDGLFGWGT